MYSIKKIIKKLSTSTIQESYYRFKTEYYNFGCKYFGPLLYGFTEWLWNLTSKYPEEKVFFFSRDGYMMEKAYSIFNNANKINSQYVYFSRNSIRHALLFNCKSYEDSLMYLSLEKFVTFGKILEYYGFSAEERKSIALQNHILESKEYEYRNLSVNEELRKIYIKYKKIIEQKSKEQAELLIKYLKDINMIGTCTIVDIGWHGSMQYYLEKFIEKNDLNIELKGLYLGISPIKTLKGSTNGYLYSKKNEKLRKQILCFFGGYEKFFQSLEGSTSGYEYNQSIIKPILCDYEYKDNDYCCKCIEQLHAGAIDFVKYTFDSHLNLENTKEWAMPIVRFGKNPSLNGIKLFSFFFIDDGGKEFFISKKSLFQYSPKEFVYALNNSPWKTGFLKSVFKIPFPYFYIYRLLKK